MLHAVREHESEVDPLQEVYYKALGRALWQTEFNRAGVQALRTTGHDHGVARESVRGVDAGVQNAGPGL